MLQILSTMGTTCLADSFQKGELLLSPPRFTQKWIRHRGFTTWGIQIPNWTIPTICSLLS